MADPQTWLIVLTALAVATLAAVMLLKRAGRSAVEYVEHRRERDEHHPDRADSPTGLAKR